MNKPQSANFYERLGVRRDATIQEIWHAYANWLVQFLPNLTSPDVLTKHGIGLEFLTMTEAVKILSNPEKRKEYDNGWHPSQDPNRGEQIIGEVFEFYKVLYAPYLTPEMVRLQAERWIQNRLRR